MKPIRLILTTALFVLSCACMQVEPDMTLDAESRHIIVATLESETKTVLSAPDSKGIYYPYWSGGDAIAVYADGINVADQYSLVDGAGTARATFAGRISGESLVGLYPYSFKTEEGFHNGKLTIELPSVQSYAEGSFATDTYPMVAIGDGGALSFNNLCSVLKFSMTGDDIVQSVRFVAHDSGMSVNGKADVVFSDGSGPELKMKGDGTNVITLDCGYVILDPSVPTDFFMVIPPGTYTGGFSLEIKTFKGTVTKTTKSDVTFLRSQFRSVPTFKGGANGEFDVDNLPYNQIWYECNWQLTFNDDAFDQPIVSHTFENGKGRIRFAGPVTSIRDNAFSGCWEMTAIHLPNTITSIGHNAFWNAGITSFRTPDSLKEVGSYCFSYCYNLTEFRGKWASADGKAIILEDSTMVAYVPNAVTENLVIPEGVRGIGATVFYNSQSLVNVVIPEGVEFINISCFAYCYSLETVSLPSSLNNVENQVFYYCQKLREFKGSSGLIRGGCCLVMDGHLRAFAGAGVSDFIVPNGVYYIDWGIFNGWEELKSITFPGSLKSCSSPISENCPKLEWFYGNGATSDHHCLVLNGSLVGVTTICPSDYVIPGDAGIIRVSGSILQNNSSIRRLTVPDDVEVIDGYAFYAMPELKSLILPAKLKQCGWDIFGADNELETIYVRAFSPPSFNENEWAHVGHDGLIVYVPKGSENQYKSAKGWSNYAQYITGYNYTDIDSPDYYVSKDYSRDGDVRILQSATEGAGIPIVLMGDAFSDRQIASGVYDSVIGKMVDAFFSEEPYTTLRPMFDIYAVTVVSATEGYDNPGHALEGWFGDGTVVGGSDERCVEYARKAVGEDKINNTLIIVAMNAKAYAGTCYMYYPINGDYGEGLSVAYFPLGTDDEMLAQLVRHEAGGHGFSKLADEYAYDYMGTIPQSEIDNCMAQVPYGWWKNCDFTSDPASVKWSRFLSDERYKNDGLGCFEGGFTYWRGVWRPTENSIMRYNTGGFNAPSREAIWYRAHKLAYGDSWEYDYEAFVSYDAKNLKASGSVVSSTGPRRELVPTHPPVVVKKRWN